jgi:glycosyltransferase involved in cell wall biosynthesis
MQVEVSSIDVAQSHAKPAGAERSQAPAISVILPNYNHGKWLRRSLGALVTQTGPSMEIVLIDDGSTDNSAEVIADFRARYDCICLIQHDVNRGAYVAVRAGVAAARGEFLLFAAADDFVLPGLLARADAALRGHPDAAFFCSQVALLDRTGRIVGYRPVAPPRYTSGYMSPDEVRRQIERTDNWFVGPSVIYRRRSLAEIGFFDESLGTLCDGLAQRLLAFQHGFFFDASVLAVWMVDPTSMSAQTSLSVTESHRVIDVGRRWIADHFPADVRTTYRDLFDRRLRFSMARQCLLGPDPHRGYLEACRLLDCGPFEKFLVRVFSCVPLIGSLLVLAFMTLRTRPISLPALLRSRWQANVSRRAERADLRRRLAQAFVRGPA